VVLNHHASDQISLNTNRSESLRDAAEKLRAKIESQMDRSLYQAAWENSKKRRLADAVAQILN
jgi:hypothetical protein